MNLSKAFAVVFLASGISPGYADERLSFDFAVFRDIADNSSVGMLDVQSIGTGFDRIVDVDVRLQISSRDTVAWNGDLYAYLFHDSGFAILLNRPGRRADGSSGDLGYGDNGLSLTLDDEAVLGDIHVYRLALNGDHTTPVAGNLLTGPWAPDGRDIDPEDSWIDSPRTALLDAFDGLNPDGTWGLFIADLSAGQTMRLDFWGLDLTVAPGIVPESSTVLSLGVLAPLCLAWIWRRARARRQG